MSTASFRLWSLSRTAAPIRASGKPFGTGLAAGIARLEVPPRSTPGLLCDSALQFDCVSVPLVRDLVAQNLIVCPELS